MALARASWQGLLGRSAVADVRNTHAQSGWQEAVLAPVGDGGAALIWPPVFARSGYYAV